MCSRRRTRVSLSCSRDASGVDRSGAAQGPMLDQQGWPHDASTTEMSTGRPTGPPRAPRRGPMNATVINFALVAVLLVLGIFGLVRAMQMRSTGDRYALPLARAIGCI